MEVSSSEYCLTNSALSTEVSSTKSKNVDMLMYQNSKSYEKFSSITILEADFIKENSLQALF